MSKEPYLLQWIGQGGLSEKVQFKMILKNEGDNRVKGGGGQGSVQKEHSE